MWTYEIVVLHREVIAQLVAEPPQALRVRSMLRRHPGRNSGGSEASVVAATIHIAGDDIRRHEHAALRVHTEVDDVGDSVLTADHVCVGLSGTEDEVAPRLRGVERNPVPDASVMECAAMQPLIK